MPLLTQSILFPLFEGCHFVFDSSLKVIVMGEEELGLYFGGHEALKIFKPLKKRQSDA